MLNKNYKKRLNQLNQIVSLLVNSLTISQKISNSQLKTYDSVTYRIRLIHVLLF